MVRASETSFLEEWGSLSESPKSQLLSQANDNNSFSIFILLIENVQADVQSVIPSLGLKRWSVGPSDISLICFSSR